MRDEELIWYYSINEFPKDRNSNSEHELSRDPRVIDLIIKERQFDRSLTNSIEINVQVPAELKSEILEKLNQLPMWTATSQLAVNEIIPVLKAVAGLGIACAIFLLSSMKVTETGTNFIIHSSIQSGELIMALTFTLSILGGHLLAKFRQIQKHSS